MDKTKFASVLDAFVEKYGQIMTDTDSFIFNTKSQDIPGLLMEWRSVFDFAMIRVRIEETVRHWAVEVSADDLLVALAMTVPGSTPEKIITGRLQDIFSGKNCNGFGLKGKMDLDKTCFFILSLAEYPELKILLRNEAIAIIFGPENLPNFGKQQEAVEKALADFRKKVSTKKRSQAYSLFCWLESFFNRLDAEQDSWPGRQWLLGLMANPDQRPSFCEMFDMWKNSVRYPELQFSLENAIRDDVSAILGHQVENVPEWFLGILQKPEYYPHFLRQAVLEKVQELRVFLRFDLDPAGLTEEQKVEEFFRFKPALENAEREDGQAAEESSNFTSAPKNVEAEESEFWAEFICGFLVNKVKNLAKVTNFISRKRTVRTRGYYSRF